MAEFGYSFKFVQLDCPIQSRCQPNFKMNEEIDITPPSFTRKQFAIFTAKRMLSDLV